MFKFLKRVFGKDAEATAPAESAAPATVVASAPKPVENAGGSIEVASLSLRAILEKLPAELQSVINQLPGPDAKIVLPLSTILKQLPSGCVKMSLASLLRQAPPGTFRKAQIEEKQMVDVPLAEIFKTVDPARLNRRTGQRKYDVPDEAVGLFGHNGQTRSVSAHVAPTPEAGEPAPPRAQPEPKPAPEAAPVVEASRILRMPGRAPEFPAPTTVPDCRPAAKPAHAEPGGDLVLPLVELASTWPEEIRAELSVLPGDTKLVVPALEVSAGLQKGKVTFPWWQIRRCLQPAFSGKTGISDDHELVLSLRIVAPAFVAATRGTRRTVETTVDQSLPDFFGPARGQSQPSATAQPAAPAAAPQADRTPEVGVVPEIQLSLACETSAPPVAAPPPAPAKELTLGELFNQPDKSSWTPAELVSQTCELPGVAGAVIALEEGLVVAQQLPAGLTAETFAAFMPQIFGRLERYTSEMQLGEVTEIMFQTDSGPCQLFRIGKVFFATLGRTGEQLPASLKLIPVELANHPQ